MRDLILLHSKGVLSSHRAAADVMDGSQYFVLLIITDGVISDMVQTKEAVVNVRLVTVFVLLKDDTTVLQKNAFSEM